MPLPGPPDDATLRHGLTADLDAEPSPQTLRLAHYLAGAFGSSTAALIAYGSHAQRSGARPESAHDFFVIIDDYDVAYHDLARATRTRYSPATASRLARVLPPNVVSIFAPAGPGEPALRAKCAVLTMRDLRRACSRRAKDHFVRGRLFQQVQLAWTRDAASRADAVAALFDARAGTWDWGRPSLPSIFNTETYFLRLLETSFAAEIRPEGGDRIAALMAAQGQTMLRVYNTLLQWLVTSTILTQEGNVYRQRRPPDLASRLRTSLYFRRSKVRATLRWLKYVALYEGWLDYVVEKIARRSGMTVVLTPRERRWPLIFLWPKVFRYLRARPQRRQG